MQLKKCIDRLILVSVLLSASSAYAGLGSLMVNVTPIFHPGPYTTLTVNPANPLDIVVGTPDGFVTWSHDGAQTSREARVLGERKLNYTAIRGAVGARVFSGSSNPGRQAQRFFFVAARSRSADWSLVFVDVPA